MYEQFTIPAVKAMAFANGEAMRRHHEYIGTEHILVGLLEEESGVAARVITCLDIDLKAVRLEIDKFVKHGTDPQAEARLPQTPRAKQVIMHAIEEARGLQQQSVGTGHVLLGLLREENGVAAQVLINLGLDLERVREQVKRELESSQEPVQPLTLEDRARRHGGFVAAAVRHREFIPLLRVYLHGGIVTAAVGVALLAIVIGAVAYTFYLW